MSTVPPSISGPSSERVTVRASTGVQGDGSVNFGKLVWVEGTRLYIQVDTRLQPAEVVTLRVDLSPVPGTAMLRGTVMRVLPTAPGEPGSYLVRLDSVPADDGPRWSAFLRAKRSGGTLSDLSDVRDGSSAAHPAAPSVAERERRAVLERMRGGTSHISGIGSAANPSTSSAGTASTWSSSAQSQGGGRAAMRDALKAALNKGPAASSTPGAMPAAPPRPPATPWSPTSNTTPSGATSRSVAPGMPSVAPLPPPPVGVPAPPEDPTWLVSSHGSTAYVQVEWRTTEAFSFDVHTQLSAGVLTLNSEGRPLPQAQNLFFVLKHEGVLVQVKGTISEQRPFSATYRLDLTAAHAAELRRGARSTSTVSGVSSVGPGRPR